MEYIYEFGDSVLDFAVRGKPIPQGSVRHFGRGRSSTHANQDTLLPWREIIQHEAEACINGSRYYQAPTGHFPLEGPLALTCLFTMPKPATAPKTRITFPIKRPDTSHLLRAVEDALVAAGAMRDDAQLVYSAGTKVYPGWRGSQPVPGVRVLLYRIIVPDVLDLAKAA